MNWQGLPGLWPVADRIFLGVYPDDAARSRMLAIAAAVVARHRLTGLPTRRDLLHVTLQAVGLDGGPCEVAAALPPLREPIPMLPFTVAFDRVLSFRSGPLAPLVLCGGAGVERLEELRDEVLALILGRRPPRSDAPLTPHVTLLRDRQRLPEVRLDEPIHWIVRDVVLVRSIQGESRHVPLARWPLRG